MANISSINGNPIVVGTNGIVDDSISDKKLLDVGGIKSEVEVMSGDEVECTFEDGYLNGAGDLVGQTASLELTTSKIEASQGDVITIHIKHAAKHDAWVAACGYNPYRVCIARRVILDKSQVDDYTAIYEVPQSVDYVTTSVRLCFRGFGDSEVSIRVKRASRDKKTYAVSNAESWAGRDLRRFMGFVGGMIADSGEPLNSLRWSIRSNRVRFPFDVIVTFGRGTKINFKAFYYNTMDDSEERPTPSEWHGQNTGRLGPLLIPAGTIFALTVNRNGDYDNHPDESTWVDDDNVEAHYTYDGIVIAPINKYGLYERNLTDSIISSHANDLRPLLGFEPGSIYNNSGQLYNSQRWRIRCRRMMLPYDTTIRNVADMNFKVFKYSTFDYAENAIEDTGWHGHAYGNSDYTIPANTIFSMIVTRAGDDQHNPDVSTWPVVSTMDEHYTYQGIRVFAHAAMATTGARRVSHHNIRSVAHQGYKVSGTSWYGNSRASSYVGAAQHGFDYGECDIQFSSDNVAVCCHDASFYDANTGNNIVIADHTLEELKACDYYGEKIATFDELMAICKQYGIGMYIDHLSGSWTSAQWDSLKWSVKKYGMIDNVCWLVPNVDLARDVILPWYPKSQVSCVKSTTNVDEIVTWANALKDGDARLSVDLNYEVLDIDAVMAIRAALPNNVGIELWTIDDKTVYERYLPYVNAITSNKVSLEDVIAFED